MPKRREQSSIQPEIKRGLSRAQNMPATKRKNFLFDLQRVDGGRGEKLLIRAHRVNPHSASFTASTVDSKKHWLRVEDF
jgi:hypothetical protein